MPAHDEAALVGSTVTSVPRFVDHIVLVDDASTDDTAAIAKSLRRPVTLVRHGHNRGVGAAIATGVRRASSLGVDLIAVMAADGQMDPSDLRALLDPLFARKADFTKGNRLAWARASETMPWHRWAGNHVFSSLTRFAVGLDAHDSQCGYVALNQRAVAAIDWEQLWPGYGYPNDLLSWASLRGLRVKDVPVRPVYGDERSGIRVRHVVGTIPFVIARAWLRRRAAP